MRDADAGPGAALRATATRVLDAVLHRGRSLKAELAAALPSIPDVRDRALVEAICHAVLREPARYDAALRAWMTKPPGRRDAEMRALLYVGFAQLRIGLPAHAAVAAGRPWQRWALLAVGLAAALSLPWMIYPPVAMDIAAMALFAIALDILLGYTGLLSFGHAAFLGGAAYATGHCLAVWGMPTIVGLLFGTGVAALMVSQGSSQHSICLAVPARWELVRGDRQLMALVVFAATLWTVIAAPPAGETGQAAPEAS